MKKKTWYNMLQEFHESLGEISPKYPNIPPREVTTLRRNLIKEEYEELMGSPTHSGALDTGSLEDIAKELCDLIYVVIGTGVAYGIDMDRAFAEVHRSNMTKIPEDGNWKRRADGKIMKPETYQPADMSVIFKEKETV